MPWQIALVVLGAAAIFASAGLRIALLGIEIDLKQQLNNLVRAAIAVTGLLLIALGLWSLLGVPLDATDTTSRVLQLPEHYREAASDGCFSRSPGSTLVFAAGPPVVEDLVACRYDSEEPSRTRTYQFDIPEFPVGAQIVGLPGEFGIDEAGEAEHPDVQALWAVYQGDQQLCSVSAVWGEPGACEIATPADIQAGEPLIITESLRGPVPTGGEAVYLGVAKPRLMVRV